MADTPDTDSLVKKEPEAPTADPIISRSTSSILLVCALLLTGTLAWALYDEVYGQRPWKSVQRTFVQRYNRYLKRLKRTGNLTEKEVKASAEYQQLDAEAKAAAEAADPRKKEIDQQVELIDDQLAVITDPFQNARGNISVINYRIESASDESDKEDLRKEAEEIRQESITVEMPEGNGSGKTREEKLTFPQIEQRYNQLKDQKAKLLVERAELLKEANELAKKRDQYLKENMIGLTDQQIAALIKKNETFDYSLRQINVRSVDIVDRCETCHLGVREPLELTPVAMKGSRKNPDRLARAFVSHPNKELLEIHNPEEFGCSSCHGGNGRATTDLVKAHGQNKHWLFPLWDKENMEAGCQQCHANDRVLDGAQTLTLGKDLFQERGCTGCHRYEGFDRETDALTNTRQTVKQLEDERTENERQAKQATADVATAPDDAAAQKLLARAESLRVTNSQIEARMEQMNTQARYLMQDQKKVGPNLKDVRLKLRKEWIPVWLQNPQEFRPGTKMPTYWRLDGEGNRTAAHNQREESERKAIAAYLWQESYVGQVARQPQGDGARGKQLFETRGCMACHSIGEGDPKTYIGGDFAANLQRVGEKASYDYIVRWIHNPRERWAPYCPTEKRDLTPEDYARKNLPYVFDVNHSKCPNDGAEIQVQNMTVMPNFRLSDADARDIATYLFSLAGERSYPEASYMDDPGLKEQGRALIKQYGCAGCHEIKGFEEEQRIGKELTTEGATPIERLDFALLTHEAELGHDPQDENKKIEPWYNRKGFFDNKLATPWIYDKGKEKEPQDLLRMPKPYLTDEWRNALTTFLLGSVGFEGASVPASIFYKPTNQQKDIQDGWWVVKKYNCMGCHTVQVGQRSVLSGLPFYQTPEGKEQLPPALTTEGARVDPNWLLRFLNDPSLSDTRTNDQSLTARIAMSTPRPNSDSQGGEGRQPGGANGGGQSPPAAGGAAPAQNDTQRDGGAGVGGGGGGRLLSPQPGADRNSVRPYLGARMPTFSFSPNELRLLVRFFQAISAQSEPYIKEEIEPLTPSEQNLARALFTSQAAPCMKCHVTGDPVRDRTATAPNFLQAGERLKPGWTFRWLLDPQRIIPGTSMPSELFKKDGERWIFNGPLPAGASEYEGDHAKLLVRYMLLLTPDEQRRIASTVPTAPPSPSGSEPQAQPPTPVAAHHGWRVPPASISERRNGGQRAAQNRGGEQRRRRPQTSSLAPARSRRGVKARRATAIAMAGRARGGAFSP